MKKSFIYLAAISVFNCSITIPPITLTGSKTAQERQIVGNEKYIEKDAWLIASAKTSRAARSGLKGLTPEDINKREQIELALYKVLRTFEFFAKDSRIYRNKYIVGEKKDGTIVKLKPLYDSKQITSANYLKVYSKSAEIYESDVQVKRLNDFLLRMNVARKEMKEYSFKALDPNLKAEILKLEKDKLRLNFRKNIIGKLSKGHWYQNNQGLWVQK